MYSEASVRYAVGVVVDGDLKGVASGWNFREVDLGEKIKFFARFAQVFFDLIKFADTLSEGNFFALSHGSVDARGHGVQYWL